MIARDLKGVITATGASGTVYRLSLSVNAMCDLEEVAGCGVMQFVKRFEPVKDGAPGWSFRDVRLLLWACLQDGARDGGRELSEVEAGDIARDIGTPGDVMELAMQAVSLAFPDPAAGEGDAAGKTAAAA